jgi:hypothetical protein
VKFSLPLLFAVVLLIVSFVWAFVTREVSSVLFAVWAADVLYIGRAAAG